MDVNSAWLDTCRVVLGGEVGGLDSFEPYLLKNIEPMAQKKSGISGQPLWIGTDYFPSDAVFIGHDEAEAFGKKTSEARLDLNQIKDIDSIASAVREKVAYTGNILLGKSEHVEQSHRSTNAFFVKRSLEVSDSKYVAYSSLHRFCENIFGCRYTGDAKFGIRGTQFYRSLRCFEVILTMNCSDCYYTANMEGCENCMFSFNQKSKRHMIGNIPLPKDKYLSLKASLQAQMREELQSKKEIMGVADILSFGKAPVGSAPGKTNLQFPKKPPQPEVERSFGDTTAVLFGKRLANLNAYGDWLFEHVRKPQAAKSAKSQKEVLVTPLLAYLCWKNAMLTHEEAWAHGKLALSEKDTDKLSIKNAAETLKDMSLSTSELRMGVNESVEESVNYYDSNECFSGSGYYITKRSGYCFFAREDEHVFGCDTILYSKFCLKCHHSYNLTRCFEVSDSLSCSDCFFCHNVENCTECMFCFNVKSKRYAIGNVEYLKEEYLKIKKLVLAEIANKLEKEKKLDLNIYNVGCAAKN